MDEHKIIVAGAVLLVSVILLVFLFPLFVVLLPIVLAVAFALFRLPQCDSAIAQKFFSGWRFGGHRGSPFSFPENSFTGFVQAQKEGADLIEFDLALTKDGVAVLMHDDTLERTTNLNGPIKEKTLHQLGESLLSSKFQRDARSPAKGAVPDDRVPTLESVVKWAVDNDIRMLFDVKDFSDEMVTIIIELYAKYNLYEKAIVCSFFPWVVYKVKKASPNIITGLTWRQGFVGFSDLDKQVPRYTFVKQFTAEIIDFVYLLALKSYLPTFLGADLLLTNEKDISRAYVDECKAKNLRVGVWTVNDINQAHWMLSSLNVPILTDFPFLSEKLKRLEKFAKNGYQ